MDETRPERIVVLEDDAATLRYVSLVLERKGYEVMAVTTGEDALERLRDDTADALVGDIGLPGTDGFEIVRIARRGHPHLGMALMTADASLETAAKARASAADRFLAKPFSPAVLTDCVAELVTLTRQRRTGRPGEGGTGE